MWPYHPDLLAAPAPRYTSYPTAAEFGDDIGEADVVTAFAAVGRDDPVSLYVHIPYCNEICWYCGCNTGAAKRETRLTAYLDALEAEIDLVAARLRGRVVRIAFGGGSPNAVPLLRFIRLVDRLVTRFDAADALLSIELDPRGLDQQWAGMLGAAGVTRASLGVQTFDPHVQAAIGRVQPAAMIEAAVAELRAAGVTSLNFDLMYGLPAQDMAALEDTLDRTIALAPDRIALFGYAHIPSLLPRQRRIEAADLPDLRARFEQAWLGHERLIAAGYRPIGFDHFALPGDPLAVAAADGRLHRNFQGFTDDSYEVLIGLGASAISSFPTLLSQNEKLAGRYRMLAAARQLPVRKGIPRYSEDRRRATIIEGLLCHRPVAVDAPLRKAVAERLEPFIALGLAEWHRERLRLTPSGYPYARVIARCFDSYRVAGAGTFSNAV